MPHDSAATSKPGSAPITISAAPLAGSAASVSPFVPPKNAAVWILLGAFSLLYFVPTLLRASVKPFWFDELCTLYICRLPTFRESWAAVLHGVDFNPPFFYVIQRLDYACFGGGPVAFRLPEIFGFWLFSLSLFRFVSKRMGLVAGSIALTLPMLTGAYFYASEARPHGLVLGFLGVALVCWQQLEERPGAILWRIAFALALSAAYFTHCYAVLLVVPFAIAEAWRTLRARKLRWGAWITLALPAGVAAASFLPLLSSYRKTVAGSGFGELFFAPTLGELLRYYYVLVDPAIALLLLLLALGLLKQIAAPSGPVTPPKLSGIFPEHEIAIAVGLSLLPSLGILLARAIHGPFFARYFLGGVAGAVLLFIMAAASVKSRLKLEIWLAAFAGACVLWGCGSVLWHLGRQTPLRIVEPSTGWVFSTKPGDPAGASPLLRSQRNNDEPIILTAQLDFLYFAHYLPAWRSRFYSVSVSPGSLSFRLYRAIQDWCHVEYNPVETYSEFVPKHPAFKVYGTIGQLPIVSAQLNRYGDAIDLIRFGDNGHFLADVSRR